MKKCTKCKRQLDESFFYKDPQKKDGLSSWCRECRKQDARDRTARVPLEVRRPLVTCKCCQKKYPRSEFLPSIAEPNTPASQVKNLCSKCRATQHKREKETRAVYYRKNTERIQAQASRKKIAERRRLRNIKFKEELLNAHGNVCHVCGLKLSKKWPACCFDFHHTSPDAKLDTVANLINKIPLTKTKAQPAANVARAEADKCIVLCAICHKKLHAGDIQL